MSDVAPEERYEVGYADGESSMNADYIIAFDEIDIDFESPTELATKVAALINQVKELEDALRIAIRYGRSGMYPVNVHIRAALQDIDPEHFPKDQLQT